MAVYRFGAFALDTQTYELRRRGKAVPVEPQVFGVLKHLIENRDRVVSKDELIDAVWEGRIVSDAALSKRISAARHAVDDTGEMQTVIHTVPRRGFRFVGDFRGTENDSAGGVESTNSVPALRVAPDSISTAVTQRWRIAAVAAAVVVILAGGLAWWQPWLARVDPALPERKAHSLPDKPSIAVLPFENLSGDAKQDYLGDGISENITTALSKLPDLLVIASASTRTYKSKQVKLQQVAEELGVHYVLKGSVQRSDDQVRVTAHLIDARTGRQLWAERYDRNIEDTFALQDDITLNVLTELAVQLTEGDRSRIQRGNTNNLEAYQLVRRGFRLMLRFTKKDNAKAQRLYQRAVELDPTYALAWNRLGWTHQMSAKFGWTENPAQEQARAMELAYKALAIDPSSPAAYNLLANISGHRGRNDKAISYLKTAVALAPNHPVSLGLLGRALIYEGRPQEALPLIQKAIRLSPFSPPTNLRYEGLAYHALGRHEEAISAFERARSRDPKGPLPLVWLALTYADMDQMDEARAAAQEILKVDPSFSAMGFVNLLDYKDRAIPQHALTTLLQLGLPE